MKMAGKKGRNPHAMHKERMRKRFLNDTEFEMFAEHEILELLLGYCIIRNNANDTAHALIEKFGSLNGVLRADERELCSVEGIGMRSAVFLKLQYSLLRYYNSSMANQNKGQKNVHEEALNLLIPHFSKLNNEKMYIATISGARKVKNIVCISEGETTAVYVSKKKIMAQCLIDNADAVVLAHNHPGGMLVPSEADICFTKEIEAGLANMEIKLLEHYIINDTDYYGIIKNNEMEYRGFRI